MVAAAGSLGGLSHRVLVGVEGDAQQPVERRRRRQLMLDLVLARLPPQHLAIDRENLFPRQHERSTAMSCIGTAAASSMARTSNHRDQWSRR